MKVYVYLLSAILVALMVMVKGEYEDADADLTEVKDSQLCMMDSDGSGTCRAFPENLVPPTGPKYRCSLSIELEGPCEKHEDCKSKSNEDKCHEWREDAEPFCVDIGKKRCLCCYKDK